eukprot:SAG11_NODE_2478_length_3312_cov_24.075008_3_plen_92_part_00
MTTCLRQFGIMVSPLSRAVGQRGVGLIALVTTGLRTLSTAGPPLWWSACTDFFLSVSALIRHDVVVGWLASYACGVYPVVGQPGGLASLVG